MKTNISKIVVYLSLLVLILPMAVSATSQNSVTYFYTGDYFKQTFGETKSLPILKEDYIMYVDSDAFHAKFGVLPVAKPPKAYTLALSPGEKPIAVQESLAPNGNKTAGANVTAQGGTTANRTIPVVIVPVVNATLVPVVNATLAPVVNTTLKPVVNATLPLSNGTVIVNATPLVVNITLPVLNNTAPVANVTAPAANTTVPVANNTLPAANNTLPAANTTAAGGNATVPSEGAPSGEATSGVAVKPLIVEGGNGGKIGVNNAGAKGQNASATGAAVSGGAMPVQIIIIGLLVVVIAVMLAVLLARKEPKSGKGKKSNKGKSEKGDKSMSADWEEGDFFKEVKERKANGSIKARGVTKAAGSAASAAIKQEKKEVKPFLLKIKDEA